MKPYVILDAMGVIYPPRDDVAELLVPFVESSGGAGSDVVERAYHEASVGRISEHEFWAEVGLSRNVEDEYLAGFTLAAGLVAFLQNLSNADVPVAALTNDVGAWSRKLRRRFGLERWIPKWIVSGNHGVRKPDVGIYEALESEVGSRHSHEFIFVDDRPRNLDTARSRGWRTIWFRPRAEDCDGHPTAADFNELLRMTCR